ncbi:MAG: stage V sporulation protein AD [Sarcina sp.]
MLEQKIGRHTVKLKNKPRIIQAISIAGPKEAKGPYGKYFDIILSDEYNGKESFEKAESSIIHKAITEVIKKEKLEYENIDYLFAGDLLNQTAASNFAARDIPIPFFGLYGACSTMTESLSLAAMIVNAGYSKYSIAATSSHFSAAERQFRFPLEYGGQRKAPAQWTVTGAGAMIISPYGEFPYITHITTGMVKDYGIKDAENMGLAMAPAAVDTIYKHFVDTNRVPDDYDLIVTGDLGILGKEITEKLLLEYGYDISGKYIDCGDIIFDKVEQKVGSGGSGCGCSAVMTCSYIYKGLLNGTFKRVLIVSTGALISTVCTMQGESIPGIAHAVCIESNIKN